MPNIFLKDEALNKAPAIIGFEIARYLKKSGEGRISIFDVVDHFKREAWFSSNSFLYGLTFLYAVGLIDFDEPYLIARDAD
ncbi:hypothetical protein G6321_00042090 [Bradyrhizobium barranii subsp. barranii]|jgi:hypothetical protein|uniref:Uncharacterized protein n=1 Tax=Bradyrhizobium barranii subsp. barranii TaxID=2823807 RepID=A0A7Z0QEF2_9BRAD|nr:hypothetical protein [Bradyrhizobium barranii]UGX92244.1 hypothetical protein G6321_00042090 [Bradyrhizobium barranii subsp. barranii]